jgi:2-hydroxy-3-keto-5-methylthiopentenyl-1-phosphate phosphatase
MTKKYIGLFSSDWSECLSPNGPFEPLAFAYPEYKDQLGSIFKNYTGNKISLHNAVQEIRSLIPQLITQNQMDAYLNAHFRMYKGVGKLINWCHDNRILFMINSTGTQAYFQRAIQNKLMPEVSVIAANPFIHFDKTTEIYDLTVEETTDKPINTSNIMAKFGLTPNNTIIMGDSGGDGPHFEWGASAGCTLIGSMTKNSLSNYCEARNITINHHFGLQYRKNEQRDLVIEMGTDFYALSESIEKILKI